MKRRLVLFVGMFAVGCLLGSLIPKEEAVVDGLAQTTGFLIMEKREEPIELEWVPLENVWIPKSTEAYVPVQGIAKDEEKAQFNKYVISMLSTDIENALKTYNPEAWYRLDSAYVDVITESVGNPGQFRIVVNVNTEKTIERLVFYVELDNKTELIRYSQMHV